MCVYIYTLVNTIFVRKQPCRATNWSTESRTEQTINAQIVLECTLYIYL